jgi:hypothetical protein
MMTESLELIMCNGWTEDKAAGRYRLSVPLGWSDSKAKRGRVRYQPKPLRCSWRVLASRFFVKRLSHAPDAGFLQSRLK